jgi:hypothetical protein
LAPALCNGAVVDFGIRSKAHYEALIYGVREDQIAAERLDATLGRGESADGAGAGGVRQSASRHPIPNRLRCSAGGGRIPPPGLGVGRSAGAGRQRGQVIRPAG